MENASIKNHLFCVILAGGGGTRLWPRSTTAKPKQFLRLISDKTMLQETYDRIVPIVPPERIMVITNERYQHFVHVDLPELPKENVFAEPEKRDSAMAMGVGAALVHHRDPEGIIINLAADHLVQNLKKFHETMVVAASAASLGDYLVTVGIQPTFAHTGLGYIKIGDQLQKIDEIPIWNVEDFTEKPELGKAKAFFATGKYFWNANNYVWTASSALSAFKRHMPGTYQQLLKIEESLGKKNQATVVKSSYGSVESISIDYGVSEKSTNLLLIAGDFGWSDIGDWQVVYDFSKKDSKQNVLDTSRREDPILLDTEGCFFNGGKKLLAVVGMKDLVVIETQKVLLVVPRSKTQQVKQIVEELKSRGLNDYL